MSFNLHPPTSSGLQLSPDRHGDASSSISSIQLRGSEGGSVLQNAGSRSLAGGEDEGRRRQVGSLSRRVSRRFVAKPNLPINGRRLVVRPAAVDRSTRSVCHFGWGLVGGGVVLCLLCGTSPVFLLFRRQTKRQGEEGSAQPLPHQVGLPRKRQPQQEDGPPGEQVSGGGDSRCS